MRTMTFEGFKGNNRIWWFQDLPVNEYKHFVQGYMASIEHEAEELDAMDPTANLYESEEYKEAAARINIVRMALDCEAVNNIEVNIQFRNIRVKFVIA